MNYNRVARNWSGVIAFDGVGNAQIIKSSGYFSFYRLYALDDDAERVEFKKLTLNPDDDFDIYFGLVEDEAIKKEEKWFIKY